MGTYDGSWSWFRMSIKSREELRRFVGDNLTSRTEVENGRVEEESEGR